MIKVTPDAAAGDIEKVSGLTTSENASGSNNNGVSVLDSNNGSNKRKLDSTGSNTATTTLKPSQKTARQVHIHMVNEQTDKRVTDKAYKSIILKIKTSTRSGQTLSVVEIVAEVNNL